MNQFGHFTALLKAASDEIDTLKRRISLIESDFKEERELHKETRRVYNELNQKYTEAGKDLHYREQKLCEISELAALDDEPTSKREYRALIYRIREKAEHPMSNHVRYPSPF